MDTPVFKAGLILLHKGRVCLVQIKAKNPGEQGQVDFGLPKGTRQYRDRDGTMVDARDAATAQQHREALEPLTATLRHEIHDEIGLPGHAFLQGKVRELGPRMFHSRKGASYEIFWYVMEASEAMIAQMNPNPPEAYAVKWFTLEEVRALAAQSKINSGYTDVIEEALG